MLYVYFSKKCKYVEHLLTLVVPLESASYLSNGADFYTVLELLYYVSPFLEDPDYWGHSCYFRSRVLTARCSVFAGWHKVEILAISPSGRSPLYVSFPDWWFAYECHRELSVPSAPSRRTFSSHRRQEAPS